MSGAAAGRVRRKTCETPFLFTSQDVHVVAGSGFRFVRQFLLLSVLLSFLVSPFPFPFLALVPCPSPHFQRCCQWHFPSYCRPSCPYPLFFSFFSTGFFCCMRSWENLATGRSFVRISAEVIVSASCGPLAFCSSSLLLIQLSASSICLASLSKSSAFTHGRLSLYSSTCFLQNSNKVLDVLRACGRSCCSEMRSLIGSTNFSNHSVCSCRWTDFPCHSQAWAHTASFLSDHTHS